ncbi:MAG: FtsX-like permease family protein, partial [Actinomycetota bacterium]
MNLPARIAAGRIAWRQMWRNPGRTLLVMVLVGLPIAALVFALVVSRTEHLTPEQQVTEQMGSADAIVYLATQEGQGAPTDPGAPALLALLPPGSRVVPQTGSDYTVAKGGSVQVISIEQPGVPFTQSPVAGEYRLLSGRVPSAAGEVALSPELLHLLSTHLGATVTLDSMPLKIVGTADDPATLNQPVAVVGPATMTGSSLDYLLRLSQPLTAAQQRELREDFGPGGFALRAQLLEQYSRSTPRSAELLFAGTVLALFGMGLIVGAAFAVGLQRQLRMHGVLAANGATPSDVGAVVLFSGSAPGLVASLVAAAAGVATAAAAHPFLAARVHHAVGPTQVSPTLIGGAVILGVVAATLAALLPARHAARIPPIQALSGQLPDPPPAGRLAFGGLVLIGIGAVGTVLSLSKRGHNFTMPGPLSPTALQPIRSEAVLTVALIAMVVGCLLSVPLLVRALQRAAQVFPTSARLAARELGRHPRRTGAAVVAATIALAVPVLVSGWAGGQNALLRKRPDLGNNQLLFGATQASPSLADAAAAFQRAFPGARVGALVNTTGDIASGGIGPYGGGQVVIGGPDLLDALGAGKAAPALAAGEVVEIGLPGTRFTATVPIVTQSGA